MLRDSASAARPLASILRDGLPTGSVGCFSCAGMRWAGLRPGCRFGWAPGSTAPEQVVLSSGRETGLVAVGSEGVDQTGDGRVGGDGPEHGRLGPQHADIGQAAPPNATARARSRGIFPGSWTTRGLRQGFSAMDIIW